MAKKFLVERTKKVTINKDGDTSHKTTEITRKDGTKVTKTRTKEADGDTFRSKKVDRNPDASVSVPDASVSASEATRIDSSITTQHDAQHNLLNGGYGNGNDPNKPLKTGRGDSSSASDPSVATPPKSNTPDPSVNTPDPSVATPPTDDAVNPDGLGWFSNNWKTIAIVAGAAAIIAGIVALVKGMNKTIKVRYNKVVRTLQRAQKDFTIEERGLDMRDVMPGIGSKIFDRIAGWWNKGAKKASANGNIGLHPFCTQYKEEIATDLRQAQEAFSKIKLASDEMEQGLADEEKGNNAENSSVNTNIYDSFRTALNSDVLNESEKLDEIGAMAAISTAMTLGGLAVKAGRFLISKYKNGKPDGEAKVVQVTKQSTREICEAIIMNYGNKYINMQQVFTECGISSESLADLDMSSADKLAEVLKKYQKPENNKITTKQYTRIENHYRNMLKHYYNIGDGIIKNFAKYTNADNEKDENLLVASKEKLQNMWDSQKEFYDNNFSRIVVEIVSSYSAIAYNDFIIEKVIPVFKTGLAGDADYVLDAMPKKGEFYVLRQTEGQPWMKEAGEKQMGNTAIAEVTGFNKESKELTFKLIARMENDGNINIDDRGIASVEGDVNFDFYADGDGNVEEQTLGYGKWLALDPALTEWRPTDSASSVMEYSDKKGNKYVIYGSKDIRNKEEGYDKIYYCEIKSGMSKVSVVNVITLASNITVEAFNGIFSKLNFDFKENSDEAYVKDIQKGVNTFGGKTNEKKADSADKVVEIINAFLSKEGTDIDVIYGMENDNEQLFVFGTTNNKESINGAYIVLKAKESAGLSEVVKVAIDPALLKDAYSKIFTLEFTDNKFKFGQCGDEYSKIATMAMGTKEVKQEKVSDSNGLVQLITNMLTQKQNMKPIGGDEHNDGDDKGKDGTWVNFEKRLDVITQDVVKCIEFKLPQQNQQNTPDVSVNPTQRDIGMVQSNNPVTKGLTIKLEKNENQQWLHIVDAGIYYTNKDMTWQNPTTFSIGFDVNAIKSSNGSPVPCKLKLTEEFGIDSDSRLLAKPGTNLRSEIRRLMVEYGKKVDDAKVMIATDYNKLDGGKKQKWSSSNESIQVSYSHKVLKESVATNTVITRTFKNFPRKSYVLSESYFDLGRDTSKLSNPAVAKRFKTKANVYEYVKNNLDAKIYKLTESQTYNVCSYTHNKPSLMTPLYENVYVVRFDDDDNVSSIKYLGKFKIQ